ncbi:hypothetical protein AAEX28_07240 [Lentisphaerota bacterium WC36G]|nr:hypothetical protein LJT99_10105 [Lentisphaerae bacterium WC36]UDQ99312.1 hypothetical protein LJT99_07180 [Lentisphaerae bacterium WC36]UDQ99407.1 hypothetical protein LJT99_07660 [Lentisphaerae bacterium WC36]
MSNPFCKIDGATKAWLVSDSDNEKSYVIFCNHGLQARRLGAEFLGDEFEFVLCDRAKEYDQYANIDGNQV